MSVRATSRVSRAIIVAAVLLLAVVTAPRQGQAATGEILQTVTLVGTAADCGSAEGTSVALVQGSKVGFPQYPVLLVTTCIAGGGSASAKDKRASLYFVDPGSGSVVKTIKTTVGNATTAPGSGWAQLVLAPDKGVLLGCATEGSLYRIDFNELNQTVDGTTVFVKKPAAACGGLAWDPSNNSIYQASGSTIFHFDFAGTNLSPASFAAPSGCVVSGLSVVGGVLLVTCDGSATVHRRTRPPGPSCRKAIRRSRATRLTIWNATRPPLRATSRPSGPRRPPPSRSRPSGSRPAPAVSPNGDGHGAGEVSGGRQVLDDW